MGQYFRAINISKREYVSPWEIGFGAKLWEWCANRSASIFPYLLRKSSSGGGGDIHLDHPGYAGRWAGDEVYLIGDYDETGLYQRTEMEFTNIAAGLVEEYNRFIEIEELMLEPPEEH